MKYKRYPPTVVKKLAERSTHASGLLYTVDWPYFLLTGVISKAVIALQTVYMFQRNTFSHMQKKPQKKQLYLR